MDFIVQASIEKYLLFVAYILLWLHGYATSLAGFLSQAWYMQCTLSKWLSPIRSLGD